MRKKIVYKILRRLIDAPISPILVNKIHLWLMDYKDRADKDQALYQIWMDTTATFDNTTYASLAETKQKIGLPFNQNENKFSIVKFLRYAAIFVFPLITGLSAWFIAKKTYSNVDLIECYVPNGEQDQLTLPDGSLIHLNSGTTIIYPRDFSASNRTVYLSGEAFFSIVENKLKPFIVHSGGVDIQVLGTKFNVDSYSSSQYITTTLEQGSVKVFKNNLENQAVVLKPNEQLIYSKEKDVFTLEKTNSKDYTSWVQGELRFINESLSDIINQIERRYNVKFRVDVQSTDLYTMSFKKNETIEDVMRVFTQLVGDVSYRIENREVFLNSIKK